MNFVFWSNANIEIFKCSFYYFNLCTASTNRFFSKRCKVIADESEIVCQQCMVLHVQQADNDKKCQQRKEKLRHVSLPKRSPITQYTSKERIQVTISSQRAR